MKNTLSLTAALLVLGFAAAPVRAHDDGKGGKHEMMLPDACKQDADQFCKDLKPGDGKFGPCMKEHGDQLSEGCKRAIHGMHEAHEKMANVMKEVEKDCQKDVDQYCKGDKPGDGKYMPCLHEHMDALSGGCKDALKKKMGERGEKMTAKKKELESACASDTDKYCKGDKPGDGKWGPCLKEHKDQLSDSCKDAWHKMMEGHEKMGKDKMGGDKPAQGSQKTNREP